MSTIRSPRSPGTRLGLALLIGFLLMIPTFVVYLLVYDRQNQSETARESIAAGWGGEQTLAGPILVIPYQATVTETQTENGKAVTTEKRVWRELKIAPSIATLDVQLRPERRHRSIYEAVVYTATAEGSARFDLPIDLARIGLNADTLDFARAELRFGVSDPRGLVGRRPVVRMGARPLPLQPGKGPDATGGAGFFSALDAAPIRQAPLQLGYRIDFRGNGALSLVPQAGESRWRLRSNWPHPSFQGGFLPTGSRVTDKGFEARYAIGNLALGRALAEADGNDSGTTARVGDDQRNVKVTLVEPVDIYSQVNRSVKYGFLFIGFTFLALLLFDIIAGVHVSSVAYLLVGAGLVLFFVMLLAFAEVIGFSWAYILASGAIIALLTAYSAAVLGSRARAAAIFGLLAMLYTLLFVLLSLEAWSLLIGSLLLFVALAAIMYLTRNVDWGAVGSYDAE